MQAVLVAAFTMWNLDACPALETPLDSTGTLDLHTDHKVVSHVRAFTLLLLQGGLALGFLSLGNYAFWIGVGAFMVPLTLYVLPAEAQGAVGDAISTLLSTVFSSFGGVTSGIDAIMKEREQSKIAEMAKKADAMAAAVAADEGDDAKSKRKGEASLAASKMQAKSKTAAKKKR